jgi:hypothetical protein
MPDLGDGFGWGWQSASDAGGVEYAGARQAPKRRAAGAAELRAWLVCRSARRALRGERLAALGAEPPVSLVVGSAMQAARLSLPRWLGRSLQRYLIAEEGYSLRAWPKYINSQIASSL